MVELMIRGTGDGEWNGVDQIPVKIQDIITEYDSSKNILKTNFDETNFLEEIDELPSIINDDIY